MQGTLIHVQDTFGPRLHRDRLVLETAHATVQFCSSPSLRRPLAISHAMIEIPATSVQGYCLCTSSLPT
jgi:hypothetical protein